MIMLISWSRFLPALFVILLLYCHDHYGQFIIWSITMLCSTLFPSDESVATLSFTPLLIMLCADLLSGKDEYTHPYYLIALFSVLSILKFWNKSGILLLWVVGCVLFPFEMEFVNVLFGSWLIISMISDLLYPQELSLAYSALCLLLLQHPIICLDGDLFALTTVFSVFQIISHSLVLILIISVWNGNICEFIFRKPCDTYIRSASFLGTAGGVFYFYLFPRIHSIVHMNAFQWIYRFLTKYDNGIAGKVCVYWSAVLVIGIPIAQWAMKQLQLTKTEGRKIFHALILLLFLPPLSMTRLHVFVSFAGGVTLCIFLWLEYLRLYVFHNQLSVVNEYFELFVTENEQYQQGRIITSHVTLLVGCAAPLWMHLYLPNDMSDWVIPFIGLITVGVGDAMAAVVGSRYGQTKWPHSRKSYVGSLAAFLSMLLFTLFIIYYTEQVCHLGIVIITLLCTTFAEVLIPGNDNLILPSYCTLLYILLKSIII